jgi:hypothetical protein
MIGPAAALHPASQIIEEALRDLHLWQGGATRRRRLLTTPRMWHRLEISMCVSDQCLTSCVRNIASSACYSFEHAENTQLNQVMMRILGGFQAYARQPHADMAGDAASARYT